MEKPLVRLDQKTRTRLLTRGAGEPILAERLAVTKRRQRLPSALVWFNGALGVVVDTDGAVQIEDFTLAGQARIVIIGPAGAARWAARRFPWLWAC